MKVLVAGSKYRPVVDVMTILDRYQNEVDEIITGDSTGADEGARAWAKTNNVHCRVFESDWMPDDFRRDTNPESATRNRIMIAEKPDLCLAFPMKSSKGTWDCVKKARSAGIHVTIIASEDDDRPSHDRYIEAKPCDAGLMEATMNTILDRYAPAILELAGK
jgi:hypothetical protein